MPRLLFEKTGNSIWISHLDLMRVFQRAFKRAGLPLTHTKGFNPRPSVSIALPLSLGIESRCELLDFDLEGDPVPMEEIRDKLNAALISGVNVLDVYEYGRKIRHLALLDCILTLEYDNGIPQGAAGEIEELLHREEVSVEKKSKSQGLIQQNIIPMIKKLEVAEKSPQELELRGLICCQNPTLNPMQLPAAIEKYLPELKSDFVRCARLEIFDGEETIFR